MRLTELIYLNKYFFEKGRVLKKLTPSCITIIALIVILFFVGRFIVISKSPGRLSFISSSVNFIVSPVNSVLSSTGNFFSGLGNNFISKSKLNKRILSLEKENEKLRLENIKLKEQVSESADLEKQLDFRKHINFKTIPAKVLYYSSTSWFDSAFINAGSSLGVSLGQGVINKDGLIGQVVSLDKKTSLITSLTDGSSSIGGMVQRTRVKGLVKGDFSDILTLTYVKSDADILIGDICVTSGDGNLIPAGIPIGKVKQIVYDKISDTKTAKIIPFVKFDKIDNIFVAVLEKDNE